MLFILIKTNEKEEDQMRKHCIALLSVILMVPNTVLFGTIFDDLGNLLEFRSDIDQFLDAISERNAYKAIRLARSLDPDERIEGFTPLVHVIGALPEHIIVVTNFIKESKADVNARIWVKERGKDLTPLMLAAIMGYSYIVGDLLDLKADINARTSTGFTALDYAESKYEKEPDGDQKTKYKEVIELLRKHGGKRNREW
jgi:hypothetical protein